MDDPSSKPASCARSAERGGLYFQSTQILELTAKASDRRCSLHPSG